MDYAAVLEENSNAQTECIIELDASVDGQTVLTKNTKYMASTVATGTKKELKEIKATMKQLVAFLIL